ncbi:restriction endonuclease subunit S [Vibrio vulnificus]|nr:hypothetical protein [Vibrio vulnificus]ELC9582842.1 restriction endonuclease subunit S [Vibrio vulnificus]ELV8665159.1 restriction endonuclease subunit S [Vibrio vulnificus]MCU8216102.1 restriction endonuclease subunit S [Vibrio vulnificus]
MVDKSTLPQGWIRAQFSSFSELLRGVSYKKHEAFTESKEGYVPILRANNIGDELNFNDLVYVPEDKVTQNQKIQEGDIIIAMSSGSKHLVGKSALARATFNGSYGAFCSCLRPSSALNAKYVYYFFSSKEHRELISSLSKGSNINNLKREHILDSWIPLAPLGTQELIVGKIEELFSHIDAGVEGLKQAKAKLQQYRQSVLKDAVTGKLTEQWREQNADKLEPAEHLLERILDERRASWEAEQLKAFEEKGKAPKNDKWKDKYKEPVLPNDGVETDFPTSWQVVSPDMIFASVTDGDHQAPPKVSDGIPFLVIGDVNTGEIKFGDKRFVPQEYYDAIKDERKPEKGDLLYTVVGSYGIPVKVETENPFCVQRHIAILKPSLEIIRDFYFHVFNSGFVYSQATAVATGTAQKTVSLGGLRSFKLPLPPITEQEKIAEILAEKLNMANKTEATVDAKIEHASFLKSSILARAFSGELVPNTNGESAEELLDKIQLEKDLIVKTKPKRSTKRENIVTSERKPLLTVLNEQSEPVRPEELMQLAGFSSNEVEEFYIALAGIAEQVEQLSPSTNQKKNWPYEKESEFKLKLKD